MAHTRRYEFDGLIIDIPIRFDEQAKIFIEDYPDFIGNPLYTPNGNRVMFSGTDACEHTEDECLDCGACRHFKRAAEHTWFGYCENRQQNKANSIA